MCDNVNIFTPRGFQFNMHFSSLSMQRTLGWNLKMEEYLRLKNRGYNVHQASKYIQIQLYFTHKFTYKSRNGGSEENGMPTYKTKFNWLPGGLNILSHKLKALEQ